MRTFRSAADRERAVFTSFSLVAHYGGCSLLVMSAFAYLVWLPPGPIGPPLTDFRPIMQRADTGRTAVIPTAWDLEHREDASRLPPIAARIAAVCWTSAESCVAMVVVW